MAEIDKLAALAADRERIYVVIAYSAPPEHLCMKLASSGKVWYRRGTGAYVTQVAAELEACGVRGRIKPRDQWLAGTPNWIPPDRSRDDEPPETDPRKMDPVSFARRFKDATPLWRRARQTGQSALAGNGSAAAEPLFPTPAFRVNPRVRSKRRRRNKKNAA